MFEKVHIDALFAELDKEWRGKSEFDQLSRDAHLGIALHDANRPLKNIDARIATMIEKHKPQG